MTQVIPTLSVRVDMSLRSAEAGSELSDAGLSLHEQSFTEAEEAMEAPFFCLFFPRGKTGQALTNDRFCLVRRGPPLRLRHQGAHTRPVRATSQTYPGVPMASRQLKLLQLILLYTHKSCPCAWASTSLGTRVLTYAEVCIAGLWVTDP